MNLLKVKWREGRIQKGEQAIYIYMYVYNVPVFKFDAETELLLEEIFITILFG